MIPRRSWARANATSLCSRPHSVQSTGDRPLGWLQSLATEFGMTVADPTVWLSIGRGAAVRVGLPRVRCLAGPVRRPARARRTGRRDPRGRARDGVSWCSASWWAAVASGGRSSFTPVAVGFAIAIALAPGQDGDGLLQVRARRRSPAREDEEEPHGPGPRGGAFSSSPSLWLYGSTLTLEPTRRHPTHRIPGTRRYYSVLGQTSPRPGPRLIYTPSGFRHIPDLPVQSWYHWGELWLAAAVITSSDAAPLEARYFVVLPLLVLLGGGRPDRHRRSLGGSDRITRAESLPVRVPRLPVPRALATGARL